MDVDAYRISKAAQNMIFGNEAYRFKDTNVKCFLYGPGPTQSNFGGNAEAHPEWKTAAEGTKPIAEMLRGEKDEDCNKFLHWPMTGERPLMNMPW